MKRAFIAVAICLVMVSVAAANTVREDCGCGLGGYAIGDKEGLVWNLVGTFLNGISGNQTFAMSTGTLDCGRPTKLAVREKIDTYVSDNMDVLAADIARGHGEALDALAEIAGIPAEKKAEFYSILQNRFTDIYASEDVTSTTVAAEIAKVLDTI